MGERLGLLKKYGNKKGHSPIKSPETRYKWFYTPKSLCHYQLFRISSYEGQNHTHDINHIAIINVAIYEANPVQGTIANKHASMIRHFMCFIVSESVLALSYERECASTLYLITPLP